MRNHDHQPVSPTSGVSWEVPLPQVMSYGASMGIPRCSHEVTEEGDPLVNPEDEMNRQIHIHDGDTYDKDCEQCRRAMGMQRPHKHGKSTTENVMRADLSGPHPEAVGTKFKYMLVTVFNAGPGKRTSPVCERTDS